MVHFGDITKIKGDEVPAVDVITGGSPCQDLSVAGKRAGLAGERSGLFMEQIRLIKEMRNVSSDNDRRVVPRFMVWENVYGAFTSNRGEDFRAVLEETVRIKNKDAVISGPPKGGWSHAGVIVGDGYSVAWRGHDAQWWGVPQRRRRICLLADFEGDAAPRILFESELRRVSEQGESDKTVGDIGDGCRPEVQPLSEGVPRDTCESRETGQDIATNPQDGVGATICYSIGSYNSLAMKSDSPDAGIHETDVSRTLDMNGGSPASYQGGVAIVATYDVRISSEGTKNQRAHCYETDISRCLDQGGENPDSNHDGVAIICIENHPNDSRVKISEDGICQSLTSRMGTGGNNVPLVMAWDGTQTSSTLTVNNANGGQRMPDKDNFNCVIYGLDRAAYNQGKNAQYDFSVERELAAPLTAKGPGAVLQWYVRRLTPTECQRLQGFPDGWYDLGDWVDSKGKRHKESDAPKYKAAGNSIALPFWRWLAKRIVAEYDRPVKMASLFDGIGGFPLSFSEAGAIPVWASEIEEFPIAVTKARFKEE